MRPSVFISSTITDLHYLRDAIRDVVVELGYNPIMSEYGDFGLISNDVSIIEACSNAIKDCHIAVLLIGKKYGHRKISVTHQEFRTAKEQGIPILCLIDKEVLAYKKVHDVNKGILNTYPDMDDPQSTFDLIDEFTTSHVNNGYRPFETVSDVRSNTIDQLAHFFGKLLKEQKDPIKSDIKDILSEIRALKNEIVKPTSEISTASQQVDYDLFQRTTRGLIDDSNKVLFIFIKSLFKNSIDSAINIILESSDLKIFVEKAGWTYEIKSQSDFMLVQNVKYGYSSFADEVPYDIRERNNGQHISFVIMPDTRLIRLNQLSFEYLNYLLNRLRNEVRE